MRVRRPIRGSLAALAFVGLSVAAPAAWSGSAGAAQSSPSYYVSLGDSYSVGYQPGLGATPGYSAYAARKTHLTLANFGCAGATTTSIIDTVGCPDVLPHTPGAMTYTTTTQAAAAEAFIAAHPGRVRLITVSIGGNDVTSCAEGTNPVACVATALKSVAANVVQLATGLRTAAGPKVPIIGLTYPDVLLGEYVYPSQPPTTARVQLAQLSVTAFQSLVNPALTAAYAPAKAALLDVTAGTGAYVPLTRTVTTHPYGRIPVAVASVCALTWFCSKGNIHATTKGYTLIGKLVVAKYSVMRRH